MKAKNILALFLALALMLLATPVYALGLGISPAEVNLDVPADGSTQVDFKVYKFTGDVLIELEDIPLRVEPATIYVEAKEGGFPITVTFYGNEDLGNQTYQGYVKFLGQGSGNVAVQIKVIATINHIVGVSEESPPEETPPAPPPASPPQGGIAGLPLNTVIIIAGGFVFLGLVALSVTLAVRRRY